MLSLDAPAGPAAQGVPAAPRETAAVRPRRAAADLEARAPEAPVAARPRPRRNLRAGGGRPQGDDLARLGGDARRAAAQGTAGRAARRIGGGGRRVHAAP